MYCDRVLRFDVLCFTSNIVPLSFFDAIILLLLLYMYNVYLYLYLFDVQANYFKYSSLLSKVNARGAVDVL